MPYSLVYNFNGVPNPITDQVEFFGSFINNVAFRFDPMIATGFTYSIIHGQQSIVYLRNFQLWNSPFSLELAKLRSLRSPNTKRFEHTLVAHYRFDEAGGNLLFNTSPLKQRIDSKIIEDIGRSDIDWVHYVYLNANETFDPESKRPFLFCLEPNSRRIGKHCECNAINNANNFFRLSMRSIVPTWRLYRPFNERLYQ